MKYTLGMDALPHDPELLQQLIRDLVGTLQNQTQRITELEHQLAHLQRYQFGRRSEAMSADQLVLWPATPSEPTPPIAASPSTPSADDERPSKTGHGRRPLPEHLPRERVEYDLPAADQCCAECGGELTRIGEEVSSQLDYQPASLFVRESVRAKYACRRCGGSVKIADGPTKPIEKGLPGSGLLAHVLVSKYADHLPLHRLEGILRRHQVTITRSTMCDWIAASADLLEPLVEWMRQNVLASRVMNTDDTPVSVQDHGSRRAKQNSKGKKKMRQGRFWTYVGDRDHPQVVYHYTPSRKRDGPVRHLQEFKGYLQADAYGGYDGIYAGGEVIEVACWAHARRKFFDALASDPTRCQAALGYIGALYEVERKIGERELDDDARHTLRQQRSAPLLKTLETWLDEQLPSVLPKSPLGEAIGYTRRQWTALNRYLEHGWLSIDNNAAERALRGIAVGRKNWLFCGSDEGGHRAAVVLSLIATCRRHDIEPFAYLRDVLQRVPDHPISRISELTPLHWKAAQEASKQPVNA